jgi:hypothetical protein
MYRIIVRCDVGHIGRKAWSAGERLAPSREGASRVFEVPMNLEESGYILQSQARVRPVTVTYFGIAVKEQAGGQDEFARHGRQATKAGS